MGQSNLLITSGDLDGIGLEVTVKALAKLKSLPRHRIVIFADQSQVNSLSKLRFNHQKALFVSTLDDLSSLSKSQRFVFYKSKQSPPEWVEAAGKLSFSNPGFSMVTGPLSKTLIHSVGIKEMGHTGILKRITGAPWVHMLFLGNKFNVMLATEHIPLSGVPNALNKEKLQAIAMAALNARSILKGPAKKRPVGILGLNPHAGESGLIGQEESSWFPLGIKNSDGPLVPDAAFLPQNSRRFSILVALYHDQGLIPFKLAHPNSGAHLSWGLPFIRTSVDHGTAKDIFGKGRADSTSMYQAIVLAAQLSARSLKLKKAGNV